MSVRRIPMDGGGAAALAPTFRAAAADGPAGAVAEVPSFLSSDIVTLYYLQV